MFRSLRAWSEAMLEALQGVTVLLQELLLALRDISQGKHSTVAVELLEGRVGDLERSRELHEAQMEAELLKANNERKAARAAEERAKYAARRAGSDDDGEQGELPAGYAELLRGSNAEGGSQEGLPNVRPAVGSPRQEKRRQATRMKFGG